MSSTADEPLTINNVYDFLNSSTPHDVILKVENKKFYVQTELLSAESVFFKSLFEPLMEIVETKQEEIKKKQFSFKSFLSCFKSDVKKTEVQDDEQIKTIELKDLPAEEFKEFLKLFYPGGFVVTADNYISLAVLSLRFGCSKGIFLCGTFLIKHFGMFDIIYMIEFSLKYGMNDIKKLCSNSISDNKDAMLNPWAEHFDGMNVDHEILFKKDSFVSKNKHHILDASEKARAFIFAEIIKAKFCV